MSMFRGYSSIMLLPYSTSSGALESHDLLLSCSNFLLLSYSISSGALESLNAESLNALIFFHHALQYH